MQVDIYCRVVDNFGDVGVTWRLARQLGTEYGAAVRLIVDDLPSLARIAPEIDPDKPQQRCGVTDIFAWKSAPSPDFCDLVIEAFACELPAIALHTMAVRAAAGRAPQWINLEYLSAEQWIDAHHLLPSPHPRHALVKRFWFPGFTQTSGGLIRERALRLLPAPPLGSAPSTAFMFAYPDAASSALYRAMSCVLRVTVAQGRLADELTQAGVLHPARCAAFVPQAEFDATLAQHDLLVVRGEDSFLRAQFAARPFLWHIYPQEDGAHLVKLNAFLDRYLQGMPSEPAAHHRQLSLALVGHSATVHGMDVGAVDAADSYYAALVDAWLADWPLRLAHAQTWAEHLFAQEDLAGRLMRWLESEAKNP
jgi:hypothetical protein